MEFEIGFDLLKGPGRIFPPSLKFQISVFVGFRLGQLMDCGCLNAGQGQSREGFSPTA